MRIEQVKKLLPFDRLVYWITERESIRLKKEAGAPKPWTDDLVLQQYFFTNPYRENDKVTRWFKTVIRDPLYCRDEVLMATVIFRWFNLPSTGEVLLGKGLLSSTDLTTRWNEVEAVSRLENIRSNGGQVFTGAFMIKAGNGPRGCKVPYVCGSITNVWKSRFELIKLVKSDCRLSSLWSRLKQFPNLGPFMSYEIVCDLRYTKLLDGATDVNSWTNLGPGASRGLFRMLDKPLPVNSKGKFIAPKQSNWLEQVQLLLKKVNAKIPKSMLKFEMREVEHSLGEWDKYERMLWGDGRSKRLYNGGAE